jgi:WD40 repeat protein
VWDTARGEKPIHVLRHGSPIDEFRGDREREDVGVKFTAWGTTPDRFYTGSSDGVLKVWNVRSLDRPLVRNLLEAPAAITAGMFCPEKSRLVIGDASGRVYMLSIEEGDKQLQPTTSKDPLPRSCDRPVHRPASIIKHPDPPAPAYDAKGRPIVAETGSALGHTYLESQKLERHPNPTIGVVQGPRYAETGLFCRDLHFNEDPNQPLLASWEAIQQEAVKPLRPYLSKRRDQAIAVRPLQEVEGLQRVHSRNTGVDCEIEALSNGPPYNFERVNEFLRDNYPLHYEEE